MKHSPIKSLTTLLVSLLVIAAFLVGHQIGGGSSVAPVWAAMGDVQRPAAMIDRSISLRPNDLFTEALARIQNEYIEPIKDPNELAYAAIRGMMASLNDPYTRFMDPKEFADFNEDNEGHFAGIGATLNMAEIPAVDKKDGTGTVAPVECPVCGTVISDQKHYRVSVVDTLPDSPARKGGVMPGDLIMKVGDAPTDGLLVSEVADKIRGPEGTPVVLTLARKGMEKPVVITLTRAIIQVPAVESRIIENNIGYLRIFQFNDKTVEETRAALMTFNDAKVRGMVLDLRNNPGGLLQECIKVASMMLPSDKKVIVSTKGRDGVPEPYNRVNERVNFDKPIVVLVNKGSASASEILSGALKDYKRAKIMGDRTFGKALVQTVIRIGDRNAPCAMAITTAHYYTPNGNDVGKVGVAPDIAVVLDKDVRVLNEKDNQAQAALKELENAIAGK